MFCPICKYEYREGFTKCSDCKVDLVESLDNCPIIEPPLEPSLEPPLEPAENNTESTQNQTSQLSRNNIMFCPVCENEYEEGYTKCPECEIDLVESLDNPNFDHEKIKTKRVIYHLILYSFLFLFWILLSESGESFIEMIPIIIGGIIVILLIFIYERLKKIIRKKCPFCSSFNTKLIIDSQVISRESKTNEYTTYYNKYSCNNCHKSFSKKYINYEFDDYYTP